MKKYKVGLIGAFGFKEKYTGGQPVKSRNIYKIMCDIYGDEKIKFVETIGWKKKPIRHLINVIRLCRQCEEIIMLPANNGVKLYTYLLPFICNSKTKLYYCVIGGWLPSLLKADNGLKCVLMKRFKDIWVETKNMYNALNELGLTNVHIVPNFKYIDTVKDTDLSSSLNLPPYRLCTFSRVMKEKGIEDAITAVINVNNELGKEAFLLDIYGAVDESYHSSFDELMKKVPNSIKYCGCVDSLQSVEIIKNYYALLFPTYYEGEGFAGTLIDALSAGVPVIASDWKYNSEIITDDLGILYEPKNVTRLQSILIDCYNAPENMYKKKKVCLEKSKEYSPETVFNILKGLLEN